MTAGDAIDIHVGRAGSPPLAIQFERLYMKKLLFSLLLGGAAPLVLPAAQVIAAEQCPQGVLQDTSENASIIDSASAYYGDQAFAEVAHDGPDAKAMADQVRLLHQELMSRDVQMKAASAIRIELTADESSAIGLDTLDAAVGRVQVGVERAVGEQVRFDGSSLRKSGDSVTASRAVDVAGAKVWSRVIRSSGATGLRVHFAEVKLPDTAAIYVYNTAGDAFGPYSAEDISDAGDFWSNVVDGEELRIQIVASDDRALAATSFTIADVAHIGPRFRANIDQPNEPELKSFCAQNASCVINAQCMNESDWSNIELMRRAVAHYVFQVDGNSYICSGGLLNDSNPNTTIPYFLTANHCINTAEQAASIEAFWQFIAPCNGNCFSPYGTLPSTLGATLVQTDHKQDFAFLRLKKMPPNNSVYLGWTANPVAYAHGTALYRISHPKGAPQAFSRHTVNRTVGTCQGLPRGFFIYSNDKKGETEGGSSGSVVANADAQVVGQLLGACGENPEISCDNAANATVDGAFAAYYPKIKAWLNP